ncbi:cytochrome P450 26B1-like [Watersipora subatra]|uniref:cytochrome P450 26B1-like n=1 Tax=Watersipora subatra TaxID=2589382 RepID=UPI00355B0AC7
MDVESVQASLHWALQFLVPATLVLFSISLWKYYVNSTKDASSSLPLPPGTVGYPFVGETLGMIFKGFEFYRSRREKHGHIYKTHVLGKPTIRVWGNENINKVLKNEESLVTMSWPTSVKDIMGHGGLITSTRKLHNTRRAIVMKAFTCSAINGYADGMERIISKHIKSWCDQGQVMALAESRKLAFETTANMLLGCSYSPAQMRSMMANMEVMVDNFFTLPIDLPGFGYHKAMRARKQLLKTLDDIIMKQHDDCKDRTDAVAILQEQLQDGSLTTEELKDTLIEMLFSAYHGMSSLCCSAFLELARHPEVMDKLMKELDSCNSKHGTLQQEQMSKMPYLQRVCKELLRHSPPYGGGFRHVLKTFELEGYQIPKGWTVLYSIRDQHEAEENFKNAGSFDPDRWATNEANDSYMPFGGNGIRSCVGEKYITTFAQIFLCQVIRGCQWELVDGNTKSTHFPVQLPTNGLPLQFTAGYRKVTA